MEPKKNKYSRMENGRFNRKKYCICFALYVKNISKTNAKAKLNIMIVKHYSDSKKLLKTKEYGSWEMKPSGLWVTDSSKDSWKEWCISERFRIEQLKYNFLIKIKDKSRLLIIDTKEKFLHFEDDYIINPGENYYSRFPDWNLLKGNHSGIIIMPYFWEFRYSDWYYPWDCSSGCIWDTSILEVKKRRLTNLENI